MVRRSLFWGLTLMLGAVFIWLIINGRKEEMRQTAAHAEVVQTAQLSATRVVGTGDLEIVDSDVKGVRKDEDKETLGPIMIRNRGNLPYHNALLRLQCLDASGKIVDTRTWNFAGTFPPGQSVTIPEITLDKVPRASVRMRISIAYSDLGAAPDASQQPVEKPKAGEKTE